jgi:hypothetical protein
MEKLSRENIAANVKRIKREREHRIYRQAVMDMWDQRREDPPSPPPMRPMPGKVERVRPVSPSRRIVLQREAEAAAGRRAAAAAAEGGDENVPQHVVDAQALRAERTLKQKRHLVKVNQLSERHEREQRESLHLRATRGIAKLTEMVAWKMRRRDAAHDAARAAYAEANLPKLTEPDLPNRTKMSLVRARMKAKSDRAEKAHMDANTTDAFYAYKHAGTVTTERPQAVSPSKRRRGHSSSGGARDAEAAEVAKVESPTKRRRRRPQPSFGAFRAAKAAKAAAPASDQPRPATSPTKARRVSAAAALERPVTSPTKRRFKSVGARTRAKARAKARVAEAAAEAARRRTHAGRQSSVAVIPWPPAPVAFEKAAARRRGHAIGFAKALSLVRAGGAIDAINAPTAPIATSTQTRWSASAIVLSNDALSEWAGGVAGADARAAAAAERERALRVAADAKAQRRGSLSERLFKAVAAASAALHEAPDPTGSERASSSVAQPQLDSALSLRKRKQLARNAARRGEHLHPDLAGHATSALVVLHGPTCGGEPKEGELMFGLERRTAHLLRSGAWDILVLRLVDFGPRAIERFVAGADFLARVRAKRISIDLSFGARVDSYVTGRLFRILYKLRPLVALRLNSTGLGDDGVVMLCRALGASGQHLEVLEMRESNIGDKGACALAHAMLAGTLPALTVVDVAGNKLRMAGGCALAKAAKMKSVCPVMECCDLRRNPFGALVAAGDQAMLCTLPFPIEVRV